MGNSGSYKLPEIEMETGSKEFPCTGDPFEGLDDKPKKLFQDCQDLNQTSIEDSFTKYTCLSIFGSNTFIKASTFSQMI